MTDLLTQSHATFSPCERYRYTLMRRWGDGPAIAYVLLNPSTATAETDDATVARCRRRAIQLGYGAMHVANIFALRSTDPGALYRTEDPIGPENDDAIRSLAACCDRIVCGWGNHGALGGRGQAVLELLCDAGVTPHCLRMTGEGQPGHPLYLPYALEPVPMQGYEPADLYCAT